MEDNKIKENKQIKNELINKIYILSVNKLNHNVIAILIICLIPIFLLIFYKLFNIHFSFSNDIMNFMLPKLRVAQEQILNNGIGLWNFYEGFGRSLYTESAFPSIESYLLFFFSPLDTIIIISTLHIFLGILFFYLFAKKLGFSPYASLLAGLIWSFNGYHIWLIYDTCLFGISIFIPLILLCFINFFEKLHSFLYLFLASVFCAIQFLYKRPTDHFYSLLFIFSFFLFYHYINLNVNNEKIKHFIISLYKSLFFFLCMVIFGLLISSFVTIPYLYDLLNSHRFIKDVTEIYNVNYMNFISSIEIILPNFVRYAKSIIPDILRKQTFESLGFIGFITIPFIINAIKASNKFKYYFIILGLIAFLIQFRTGIFFIIHKLPLFHGAREPIRFLPMLMFSISMLTAIGYDRYLLILNKDDKQVKDFSHTLFIINLIVLFLIFILICFSIKLNKYFWTTVIILLFNIIVFFFIYLSLKKYAIKKELIYFSILFVLIFSVYISNKYDRSDGVLTEKNNNFLNIYPNKIWVKSIQKESKKDLFRVADDTFFRGFWTYLLVPSVSFYGASVDKRLVLYYKKLVGVETLTSPKITNLKSIFYNLANVRYFIVKDTEVLKFSKKYYPRVYHDDTINVTVLKNNKEFPRYYFLSDYKVIKDDNENLEFMKKIELENPDWFKYGATLSDDLDSGFEFINSKGAKLNKIKYGSNSISIDVTCQHPSLLFISSSYNERWCISSSDKSIKVIRADYIFTAIQLPKGDHNFKLIYYPKYFFESILISIISLLILVILVVFFEIKIYILKNNIKVFRK